uniref:Tyrosinase copper-binding domain-containing protein n=1 Tax=Trichuris muris TaxID=70415 RepID=A0A5S6QQ81_TRIMR
MHFAALCLVILRLLVGTNGAAPPYMDRYPVANLWNVEADLFKYINSTSNQCVQKVRGSADGSFQHRLSETQCSYYCLSNLPWFNEVESPEDPASYMDEAEYTSFKKLCACRDLQNCIPLDGSEVSWRKKRQAQTPALRKEYRMMSDDERTRFHVAVNQLKSDAGQLISYDTFVEMHQADRAPGAHFGASFLPWHREYMRLFESVLRAIDPHIAIPYFDSTLDDPLPTPRHSIMWSEEFMGNGNGEVVTGPFANWMATDGQKLNRATGRSGAGSLFRPSDIKYILSRPDFAHLTECVDPFFETVHGAVHSWIGGQMSVIQYSPNDPVFWLHHAFIDKIWETYRQTRQTPEERETSYPTGNATCTPAHRAEARMLPFTIRNIDGLSNEYTRIFYKYHNSPTCSHANPVCGSPYIFCDTRTYRCISKVVKGGDCAGYEGLDICHKSNCVNGKCS